MMLIKKATSCKLQAARSLQPAACSLQLEAGQALVEFAIFGSMMLVVLGAMINFGVNAEIEQQSSMQAVRDAMWSGARSRWDNVPDNETYIHYNDGFVADPTNPFALGSVVQSSGLWSTPNRTFRIGVIPHNKYELPRIIMKINGRPIDCPSADETATFNPLKRLHGCTTAGFRKVDKIWGFKQQDGQYVNDPETIQPIDKYDLIYGVGGSRVVGPAACLANGNCRRSLILIDPNEGEIVSRDQAIYFCRQIIDHDTCYSQCLLTKKNPADPDQQSNCAKICKQPMEAPEYCDAGNPETYLNRDFAALFPSNVDSDIGIQAASTTSVHQLNTTFNKVETKTGIRTTSQVNRWLEGSTGRTFYFRDKGGPWAGIGSRTPLPAAKVPPTSSKNVTDAPPIIWETPHD